VRTPLSISAGAAVYPADGDGYEALLAKADRRMYSNKVMHKRGARAKAAGEGPAAPDTRAAS
jgi:GGDEF domain-containing protein